MPVALGLWFFYQTLFRASGLGWIVDAQVDFFKHKKG